MFLSKSTVKESFGAVVTNAQGQVKDTRFVKPFGPYSLEFVPNQFYLKLINSGHIQPNTWKLPWIFGKWTARKDISNGNR